MAAKWYNSLDTNSNDNAYWQVFVFQVFKNIKFLKDKIEKIVSQNQQFSTVSTA